MNIAKDDFDSLMKQLSKIADGINDSRSRALSKKVPKKVAARHLDYLLLRQQMGRQRRDGDKSVIFSATRDRTSNTTSDLLLDEIPDGATQVAVFTGRGPAAQVIDVSGYVTAYATTPGPQRYPLNPALVANNQVITRLEARRKKGYPIAIGPRLQAV